MIISTLPVAMGTASKVLGGWTRRERLWRLFQMAQTVVAGVAVCGLIFAGLDSLAPHLKLKRPPPFLWANVGDRATVLYKREPVLNLRGGNGIPAALRAQALADSLDALFNRIDSPRFDVAAGQSGTASIRAGGVVLIEIQASEAEGQLPVVFARNWVRRIEPLVRGKGTESEGCPACHVARLQQVLREAKIHAGRRW